MLCSLSCKVHLISKYDDRKKFKVADRRQLSKLSTKEIILFGIFLSIIYRSSTANTLIFTHSGKANRTSTFSTLFSRTYIFLQVRSLIDLRLMFPFYIPWKYHKTSGFFYRKGTPCVKRVRIRSYSGWHFPAFGLNMERYEVSLHIQSECGKMRTRITLNTDTFQAVTLAWKGLIQWPC